MLFGWHRVQQSKPFLWGYLSQTHKRSSRASKVLQSVRLCRHVHHHRPFATAATKSIYHLLFLFSPVAAAGFFLTQLPTILGGCTSRMRVPLQVSLGSISKEGCEERDGNTSPIERRCRCSRFVQRIQQGDTLEMRTIILSLFSSRAQHPVVSHKHESIRCEWQQSATQRARRHC